MQAFGALRMLPQKPLLKVLWNMTPMPSATTMAIITARGMSAAIIMVKGMNAVTITAMRVAAAITASRSL